MVVSARGSPLDINLISKWKPWGDGPTRTAAPKHAVPIDGQFDKENVGVSIWPCETVGVERRGITCFPTEWYQRVTIREYSFGL
jgi:hypothetical protein